MSDQRHCSLESVNVRAESACRGCGGPKDEGLLVCWHCFKGRKLAQRCRNNCRAMLAEVEGGAMMGEARP